MGISELIEKSPLRKFEKNLNGGLKHGEVGVITAKKGIGKSSLLVQLELDQLLKGKSLIHVSFSQETDRTFEWYNNMFGELAKMYKIENPSSIKNEIFRRRIVLNFNQDVVRTDQVLGTIRSLSANADFKPDLLMFDDFNFANALPEALKIVKSFTKELGISTWYTAAFDVPVYGIAPSLNEYLSEIDILLYMQLKDRFVSVKAIKEHDRGDVETGIGFDLDTMHLIEG